MTSQDPVKAVDTNTASRDPDGLRNHEPKKTRTILVASLNPVKIAAALHGFQAMFPDTAFVARGISVPSGVPEQPFSDQETLLGAANRAFNARAADKGPDNSVDFWVGIEGGVCDDPGPFYPYQEHNPMLAPKRNQGQIPLQSFAWVVVLGDRNSLKGTNPTPGSQKEERENELIMGKARTSTYYLPEESSRLVRSGMELGHAEDQVWGRSNSKQ